MPAGIDLNTSRLLYSVKIIVDKNKFFGSIELDA